MHNMLSWNATVLQQHTAVMLLARVLVRLPDDFDTYKLRHRIGRLVYPDESSEPHLREESYTIYASS